MEKRKGKLLPKSEEISIGKAYTNTQKLIQYISTITDVFLNQKRINVCEHMEKMASHGFTYIYSLLIENDICDHQNISSKFPCVCVYLSSRDLFIFCYEFSFFFNFLYHPYLGTWSVSSTYLVISTYQVSLLSFQYFICVAIHLESFWTVTISDNLWINVVFFQI